MKNAARALISLCFLVCAVTLFATKAYDGWVITVTGSDVNGNDVRLIYARSGANSEHFLTFKCNEGTESCKTPAIDKPYFLSGSSRFYSCDEYVLGRSGEPDIVACLISVY